MAPNTDNEHVGGLIADIVSTVMLRIPMMLSAAVVAGLAHLVGTGEWQGYVWLIASPVLYLCWLITFLLLSALTCGV
jgi:hypothetical protein